MEEGRITEEGPHSELIGLKGRYHKLYTQQSLFEMNKDEENWQG